LGLKLSLEKTSMAQAKPLTKSQIVASLAEENGLTKKQAASFLESLQQLAVAQTKKSGKFVLPGLGILVKANRKARVGRNPATGEPINIPAKTVVKFRVAKAVKDVISPPKK
jgi:DNA-binding protein HU-beta